MPSTITKVVSSIGNPTLRRRGAQALRGRPISVSVIGAAISMLMVSPTHQ
ncbi:hypothetical protein [Paucibacter sp. XJ19-41]|nr:hypothetical protein [Paucibacter sp. XJ19-41]MDC6167162.1 hypothetical protein [Paucibacter sp. XJ19-41]